jgi:hypothetical protein
VGRLSRAHGRYGSSGLPCVLLITGPLAQMSSSIAARTRKKGLRAAPAPLQLLPHNSAIAVLGCILLACTGPAAGARDAGSGCPVGWGGGVGNAGEREGPDCQSVRRSFPSIQTGEVVVAPSRVSPLASFRHTFPKPFRQLILRSRSHSDFVCYIY